jgi:hypothetical protein
MQADCTGTGGFWATYNKVRMFFRREKPRQIAFSERLEKLRSAGFTVEADGSKSRVNRGRCAAVIEDRDPDQPYVNKAGILIGDEIGYAVHGGFQTFIRTPSGKVEPALARDLRALHQFEEDLKEALGLTSLYNEGLGTTFDQHMYDRVVNRDRGGPERPWEQGRRTI